jgi:MinD superfamily P-loop ATPase
MSILNFVESCNSCGTLVDLSKYEIVTVKKNTPVTPRLRCEYKGMTLWMCPVCEATNDY